MQTSYTDRLPKHLSYPVRLGELVEALASVLHFSELSVSFHRYPGTFASTLREAVRSGKPYPIFVTHYLRRLPGLSASDDASRAISTARPGT